MITVLVFAMALAVGWLLDSSRKAAQQHNVWVLAMFSLYTVVATLMMVGLYIVAMTT